MSEIQNRAIQIFRAEAGGTPIDSAAFRQQMLQASLALFKAMGGSEAMVQEQIDQSFHQTPGAVDALVGEILVAMAGVSYLNDMDMMQAAYNTLRQRVRQLSPVACAAE